MLLQINYLPIRRYLLEVWWNLGLEDNYTSSLSLGDIKRILKYNLYNSFVKYIELNDTEFVLTHDDSMEQVHTEFIITLLEEQDRITLSADYKYIIDDNISIAKLVLGVILILLTYFGLIAFLFVFVLGIYAMIETFVYMINLQTQFAHINQLLRETVESKVT